VTCVEAISDAAGVTMKHVQLSAPGIITDKKKDRSKSSGTGSQDRKATMMGLIYVGWE
jgi:hypothetical protein